MPWGKGSITPEMATGLRCQDRRTGLDAKATHTKIFYNLGMDRVHFIPQTGILHFVDSEHFQVLDIINNVYRGLSNTPRIEQLFLDEHGYYKGALMLMMSAGEVEAVLVALRLKDIKISIASD
jgi:hypothetical protein